MARDPKGALLCLDGHESLSCDECDGVWIEPPVDADVKTARWSTLQSCGQMEPQRHKANLTALNRRLKGATPIEPEFTHEDWVEPPTSSPLALRDGRIGVLIAADTITVTTPDGTALSAPWRAEAALEEGERLSLQLYAFGTGYLGALTIKNPEYMMERTLWLPFLARPAPTMAAPDAATITPMVARWLEAFCTQTLNPADWDALEKAASSGSVSPDGLMALFNTHGALHGYVFKRELWLNDFFYANDRLPERCRARVRQYPSASAVPASFAKDRDRLRALWHKHRR